MVGQEVSRLDPLVVEGPGGTEAFCLSALGREEEALRRSDAALAIEPDMLLARLARAMTLIMLGRLEEASAVLAELAPMVTAQRLHPACHAVAQHYLAFKRAACSGDRAAVEAAVPALSRLAAGEAALPAMGLVHEPGGRLFADHGCREAAIQIIVARRQAGTFDAYDQLVLGPREWRPCAAIRGSRR